MAAIQQHQIAHLALILRNYLEILDNSKDPFSLLYVSVILAALEVPDNKPINPRITRAIEEKGVSLALSFFRERGPGLGGELVPRHLTDSHENIIRNHFKTFYPEIELCSLRSDNLETQMPPNSRSIKADFIIGLILAVTGAVQLLLATIALIFVPGLIVPAVAGSLGLLELFGGMLTLSNHDQTSALPTPSR